MYYTYTAKIDKIPGANGLPIHNQAFDDGVVTHAQVLSIAPLAILYFFSRLYISVEALASLRAIPAGAFVNVQWTTFVPHL